LKQKSGPIYLELIFTLDISNTYSRFVIIMQTHFLIFFQTFFWRKQQTPSFFVQTDPLMKYKNNICKTKIKIWAYQAEVGLHFLQKSWWFNPKWKYSTQMDAYEFISFHMTTESGQDLGRQPTNFVCK